MIFRPLILAYGVAGLAALLLVAYLVGRCDRPDTPARHDLPPEVIPEEEVVDFAPDPEPTFIERFTTVEVPVYSRGAAVIDTARVNEYIRRALAAADSTVTAADTLPPMPPLLRVETQKDEGVKVGVQFSDNRYHAYDFPGCRHPCTVNSADTTLVARERRQLPGFDFFKDTAVCAAMGGAGYGVGVLVGLEEPWQPAAVAGGACVLVKVLD